MFQKNPQMAASQSSGITSLKLKPLARSSDRTFNWDNEFMHEIEDELVAQRASLQEDHHDISSNVIDYKHLHR
jgi:hypothetical protein